MNNQRPPNLNFFAPLTPFTISVPLKPEHNKDLSPTIYKPFLIKLFNLLSMADPQHPFVLSGSAAKQLQNDKLRNPNDIDILTCSEELVQAHAKIIAALQQIPNTEVVFNDKQGTLMVSLENVVIKIQLIDTHTSRHCYPPAGQFQLYEENGEIPMLAAAVIPEREVITNDDNDEIELEEESFTVHW